MRRSAALVALLALAGCGAPDAAPAPGEVTAGEARALDDAAEMLESPRAQGSPASPGPSS